jgi:hypothetical protein
MPIDCTSLLALRTGNFSTWHRATSAAITAYQAKGSVSQADSEGMFRIEQELFDASRCLTEAISGLSSSTSEIAELNQEILHKTKELSQAEEDIAVAKDRVGYLRHPERNTSSYESWFPIDRPISVFSLVLIVCSTVFLLTFLILLTLSFSGLNLTVFIDPSLSASNPVMKFIVEQFTASFWLLLIAFIVILVYYIRDR